jgi:DNA (cytosine-5)-methyltransferase 1
MSKIKVVELFAGVGGFRIGLEGCNGRSSIDGKKLNSNFKVIWSNQFEPSTKRQHANEVYESKWGSKNHSPEDIEEVIEHKFDEIKDHDLLVGGFPCQDYSVATTLKRSKGLFGKKGVLWWSIYSIIKRKGGKAPRFLFLENVDRLLVSPAKQRGRDFAVMLSCLYELGYAVEWRVIDASEYGFPQRRKRVYILAYKKGTSLYKKVDSKKMKDFAINQGVFAKSFPVESNLLKEDTSAVTKFPDKESESFNLNCNISPFYNTGVMKNGKIYTCKTQAVVNINDKKMILSDLLEDESKVPNEYIISNKKLLKPVIKKQIDTNPIVIKTEIDMWKYLKGRKKEERYNKNEDYKYKYAEGKMAFPDRLDRPSRTIITGEGGASPSRFKHIIKIDNKYRRLTPVELERLNMFPDNHTKVGDITDSKRAFFMGNALVIGVVEKIGIELAKEIEIE